MSPLPASAQLAQWIEREHPKLFTQLYSVAISKGVGTTQQLHGFGDDFDFDASDFGSDSAPSFDLTSDTDSSFFSSAADSTGNFLSSAGSGLASAASSVGSWLVSAQGLNTLANLGTAVLKTQATVANANLQSQVLQAQVQRAQAGQSPLPITYVQGSNGQPVPVYQTGTSADPYASVAAGMQLPPALAQAVQNGQAQLVTLPDGSIGYTLNQGLLSQLTSGGLLSNPFLWLIGGGLLLLAVR